MHIIVRGMVLKSVTDVVTYKDKVTGQDKSFERPSVNLMLPDGDVIRISFSTATLPESRREVSVGVTSFAVEKGIGQARADAWSYEEA